MTARQCLRIGFIPLVDAAALFVAADMGFFAAEGLDVELAREVSWSNIRDRLAIGHYDAAHLLAPMAVASTLGLGHLKAPIVAPFNLALNGNAITLSLALRAELARAAEGDLADPSITARALAKVVAARAARGEEQLVFGMTFPFSTHNYQLRFWMAEGGIDPDEDVRLVVLPPPYMVESLARGQVDGFCVGAPWNSVAVAAGVGAILHFGCEIFAHAPEKVLALRQADAERDPACAQALTRACMKAAAFVAAHENRDAVAALLARPDRVGVEAATIKRTLEGTLPLGAGDSMRSDSGYLVVGDGLAGRPDPEQAAWLYAQMLRWGQARHTPEFLIAAKDVCRPAFFDSATGCAAPGEARPAGAFAGANFASRDIETYLASFAIGRKIAGEGAPSQCTSF